MNASKRQAMITWLLAMAMVLSGCSTLTQLDPAASWTGIQAAMGNGEVYTKGNQVLLTWGQGAARGATVFSQTASDPVGKWFYETEGRALLADEGLVSQMLRVGGWTKTTADQLPAWFKQALSVGAETFWLAASLFGVRWCSIVPPVMPGYGGVQN